MIRLREHLVYELDQDLFTARVRGTHPELVVNHGYEGVVALNCARRQQHPVLHFPSDDFSIYSWLMSPAGDVSYLFSGDAAEGASARRRGGYRRPGEACRRRRAIGRGAGAQVEPRAAGSRGLPAR